MWDTDTTPFETTFFLQSLPITSTQFFPMTIQSDRLHSFDFTSNINLGFEALAFNRLLFYDLVDSMLSWSHLFAELNSPFLDLSQSVPREEQLSVFLDWIRLRSDLNRVELRQAWVELRVVFLLVETFWIAVPCLFEGSVILNSLSIVLERLELKR